FCVIAGNISPIDVITHVPILCEEAEIPYVYVPSKEDLANAGATKRPTCCVLVTTKPNKGALSQEDEDKIKENYDEVVGEVPFGTWNGTERNGTRRSISRLVHLKWVKRAVPLDEFWMNFSSATSSWNDLFRLIPLERLVPHP
ncbi:hypothetical protein C1H46_034639, partial [Malus baccata]